MDHIKKCCNSDLGAVQWYYTTVSWPNAITPTKIGCCFNPHAQFTRVHYFPFRIRFTPGEQEHLIFKSSGTPTVNGNVMSYETAKSGEKWSQLKDHYR